MDMITSEKFDLLMDECSLEIMYQLDLAEKKGLKIRRLKFRRIGQNIKIEVWYVK